MIEYLLGSALLSLAHYVADEFCRKLAVELRIGQNVTFWDFSSPGHPFSFVCFSVYKAKERPWRKTWSHGPELLRFWLLWPFSAIFGTSLLAIRNSQRIEGTPDDVVSHTRKVLHTTAANEHNGVLLQIVPDSGDIGSNFYTVCQADTGDFAKRRIRFLWRHGIYANANSALLGAALKGGSARFFSNFFPSFSDQLVDSGHSVFKLR